MELTAGSRRLTGSMKKTKGCPQPLGAVRMGERTNFAVAVPAGKSCELLLYRTGAVKPEAVFEMPEEEGLGEVRFLAVEGMTGENYEYNYRIDGRICVDQYVKELSRTRKFGEKPKPEKDEVRGRFSEEDYDWEGDTFPKIPYHEVIAYSLHVRGFTKHSSSKVKHKGTFAGVAEKIPYLQELGINQIQCMPVYEFEEKIGAKVNYWGYGKGYYFAPKAAYSVSGHARRELKDMVKACHKAGIEVVLRMPFVPELKPQISIECLRYYMLEYHVDGFIVNPYNVPMEMLMQDPLLKGVKLMQTDDRFQNTMRRFLKGDEGMVGDVMWAMQHHSQEDGKCNYITDHTGFTLNDLVSYDGKHNEENGEQNHDGPDYNYSWNCGAEGATRKKAVLELRRRQIKNAFFLLMFSQGTPCILAGDEFGNTQNGNNNVYCQDNETAWLDWNYGKNGGRLLQFVRQLIAFRKKHPALHKAAALLGQDKAGCGMPDVSFHGEYAWQAQAEVWSRQLGVLYSGAEVDDDACFVACNMHWLKRVYALPTLPKNGIWYLVTDTGQEDGFAEIEIENQRQIELDERSIAFLIGRIPAILEEKQTVENGKAENGRKKQVAKI